MLLAWLRKNRMALVNGTHQPLVYADDVNILDRTVHTTEKKWKLW
jgi:hypothetical protein